MNSEIVLDSEGFPILLADVPGSGVAKIDPNARSGNDAHDTRSGKFTEKGRRGKGNKPQANVDRVSFAKMLDAVREAARELPAATTEENLTAFIQKRAKEPGAVNVQQFLQLVQIQRLTDLVDIIDSSIGTKRNVKVNAPRGYVDKVLQGLTDDDVAEIVARLQARGNSEASIDRWIFGKRIPKERKDVVKEKRDGLAASDLWDTDEFEGVDDFSEGDTQEETVALATEMAERIVAAMPPPVINPIINIPSKRKRVVRDPKTHLIISVEEEE